MVGRESVPVRPGRAEESQMRRHWAVLVVAGAAAVWCAAPLLVTAAPAARAVARAGTWGTAIEVPGLGALNQGGRAQLNSVSCGAAGNCAAVGSYTDGAGHAQALLVSETAGKWRSAVEVPGSEILNAGGGASADSVSYVSAGNCTALGSYTDDAGRGQVFVVSETDGTWGTAIKMPGVGGLNRFGTPIAHDSVSCASAGNCAAVGGYRDGASRSQVFVVSETNGTWGKAIKMPFSGILNWGGSADAGSVSCATAGNCAAGGTYDDAVFSQQAFVVSETNGTWAKAIEVPGSGTLNAGRFAVVFSVSCPSAGNCAAGGFYIDGSHHEQAFVVSQTNGAWGNALEVPGSGTLNAGDASVTSVSCRSAGRCAAGGTYTDGSGHTQAFLVNQA